MWHSLNRSAILAVLIAVAGWSPASASESTAPDFGFEDVAPTGALRQWTANSQYPFSRVEAVRSDPRGVRSGRGAVKLVTEDGKRGHLYTCGSVAVEPNRGYVFSLWAKGKGAMSAMAYLYRVREGKESFQSSITSTKIKPDAELSDGEWRQFAYRLRLGAAHADVSTARLVILASGTVLVDDCAFEPFREAKAAAAKKPTAAVADLIRPNLISVCPSRSSPQVNGRIEDGEYSTVGTGLVSSTTKGLYAYDHAFCLSCDEDRLYFALRLQLPRGYELKTSKRHRDDPALVANKDVFYFFLRPDRDHTAKAYEGVYVGVSPDGIVYDCWERIDWAGCSCERDTSFNADWHVATDIADNVWTLEMSAPWSDLRISLPEDEATCLLAFGMNLQTARLFWQAAPNWFDHYQAFGRLRLTRDGVTIAAPSVGEVSRGTLRPCFRLANSGEAAADYELTYLVSTPRMVGGGVGSYIFDQAIDVRQKDVIRDKSVYYWSPSGSLSPRQQKAETTESRLATPKFYVLELEGRVGGRPVLYQKIPFEHSPPIQGRLTPVPSKKLILADLAFHGARTEETGAAQIVFVDTDGNQALSHRVEVAGDEMRVPLSMADLRPGDYKVSFTLADKAGKQVFVAAQPFKKWETPDWLKRRVGMEALEPDWVPAPWTPLVVDGNHLSLWGRRFHFGADSLVAGIESQGRRLLRSRAVVKYRVRDREYAFDVAEPRYVVKKRGRVQIEQKGTAPHFTLTVKQQIEFDGMDRFDVCIAPKATPDVDLLWVEIPFERFPYSAFCAREGSRSGFWQHGLTDDAMFETPRDYACLWLGDDRVGCVYFAENYKGWLLHSTKPRVVLRTTNETRALRLLIVNDPSTVDAPLSFTFGLQPTPFKPRYPGWRAGRPQGLGMTLPPTNLVMVHSSIWNSCDSKPSPRSWQLLDDMLAFLHERGQKVFPYLGTFFISPYDNIDPAFPFDRTQSRIPEKWRYTKKDEATRQEEYFYFAEDWHLRPKRVGGGKMETRQEARVCPSGSWADYFVHGISEMLRRSDLDGVYLDIANPMTNLDEEKGLSVATKDGVVEGTTELFAARDLYKRLYYVFEQARGTRKPWMLGHGFAAAAPYASFWDVNFNGEEIKPKAKFEFTKMNLQKSLEGHPCAILKDSDDSRTFDAFSYRAIFGRQFGIPTMILPQYGYLPKLKLVEHSREMLSFTFLHNNLLWPAYIPTQPVYEFWSKVEVPFGMGDTTFHPYWENGIAVAPECIKVSFWQKRGRDDYLIAVANWGDNRTTAAIKLPPPLAAYNECVDMEANERIQTARPWRVAVPAHDLRVFRFVRVASQ